MIQSKLPNVGTTIFAIMSKMAVEYNAVNLSQGFPGFPIDVYLIELVNKYMKEGFNQYAPMPGTVALREAIAQKTFDCYGWSPSIDDNICVTSGATEALFSAISAVVNKGDEVIIFEPAYDSYIPAIELSGGTAVPIQLHAPNYAIDWDVVQNLITAKTKVIIYNTPHNPTGTVWSKDDIGNLKRLVENTDILIIADEVYEHIIFDGKHHLSASSDEELRKRSIVISSFGKTFHATGWKVGYALAPKNLMNEFKKTHQFIIFSTSTPFQMAIAEYVNNSENYVNIPSFYQQKRDYFQQIIKETKFEILPCNGTYFQLLSYKNLSNDSDVLFAENLCKNHGVSAIPISVFYQSKLSEQILRFCFAKEKKELDQAVERLMKVT